MADLIIKAEAIAAKRWEATMPVLERCRQPQDAWSRGRRQIAIERRGAGQWQDTDDLRDSEQCAAERSTACRLFDSDGAPICCQLCGRSDAWQPERDVQSGGVRVFLCEHAPRLVGQGSVRQLSVVPLSQIGWWRPTWDEGIEPTP